MASTGKRKLSAAFADEGEGEEEEEMAPKAKGKRKRLAALTDEEDEAEEEHGEVAAVLEEGDDESEETEEKKEEDEGGTGPAVVAPRTIAKVNGRCKMPSDLPLALQYQGGEFFFVRECYEAYYTTVETLVLEGKRCVTVTGTPGIGKSVFYAYFFIRFRMEHPEWTIVASTYTKSGGVENVAVFEAGNEKPTMKITDAAPEVVTKIALRLRGVDQLDWDALKDFNEEKKVLWLCDGPPQVRRPQSVVFTSPNERWMKIVRDDLCDYYMPPWTLRELQLAASVLNYAISDDEMQERFWKFGGVAQNCLKLKPADLRKVLIQLTEPIKKISDRGRLENLLEGNENEDTRHRFLHYEPIGDGGEKEEKLVSDMVCEKLSERLLQVIKRSMNAVKGLLEGIPAAASLRGGIFEANAHVMLQLGLDLDARLLPCRDTRGQKTDFTITVKGSDETDVFETDALSPMLLSIGPYHKPKSKTFESIDGFYFPKTALKSGKSLAPSMNTDDRRILLFQMTVSMTHPVRASGVIYVLRKLGLLEHVVKNPKRAALIFLLPLVEARAFTRQDITTTDVSPNLIQDIEGIGPQTVKTLTGVYKVKTVAELKEMVGPFKQNKIKMKDPSHKADWTRAVRSWEKRVLSLSDRKYVEMVKNIPQYVASSG